MGSLSLPDVYERVSQIFEPPVPRPLLTKALEGFEENFERKNGKVLVFLEAPTGYGKSTLSLVLYAAIKLGRFDIGQRVIHVLPLRSIGTDLKQKSIERIGRLRSTIGGEFGELDENDVGLQQMHSPGSPMLCKRFVITTLDTFVTSFYKMPAWEYRKLFIRGTAHYEVPRASIYTSVVVFDEFHLYLSSKALEEGSSKSLTVAVACIRSLLEAGVPVLVMTATMPEVVKKSVLKKLEVAGLKDSVVEVVPSGGDEQPVKRHISVEAVVDDDPISVLQRLEDRRRVLVVLNSVRKAVETYVRLKQLGHSPVLLHSRIVERERQKRLRKMFEKNEGGIFVTTQVVEAGVDVSFDVLITEAAPPDSLLQRAGRVARYGGEGEVFVLPLTEGGSKVYGQLLPNRALEYVSKSRKLDAGILKIIDEAFSGRNLIDHAYYNLLSDIDNYPSCSHKFAMKVWEAYCGFVRDGEQITVIPRKYLNGTPDLQNDAFAIDEDRFRELLKEKGEVQCLTESLKLKPVKLKKDELGRKSQEGCIGIKLLRKGIAAVILDDYDEEVGYAG
jgi:CRISPR-associated endonuclease/helicase Cas3